MAAYEKKQWLLGEEEKYMHAIEVHRAQAAALVKRKFEYQAEVRLITAKLIETSNLKFVTDALLAINKLTLNRDRAELMQATATTMKDVLFLMKKALASIQGEEVKDQSREVDAAIRSVDELQFKFNMSGEQAVRKTLSPDEYAAIKAEIEDLREDTHENDLLEYAGEDTEEDADDGVFHDVVLPRQRNKNKQLSSLLVDE